MYLELFVNYYLCPYDYSYAEKVTKMVSPSFKS
jgi:hypothetical protein